MAGLAHQRQMKVLATAKKKVWAIDFPRVHRVPLLFLTPSAHPFLTPASAFFISSNFFSYTIIIKRKIGQWSWYNELVGTILIPQPIRFSCPFGPNVFNGYWGSKGGWRGKEGQREISTQHAVQPQVLSFLDEVHWCCWTSLKRGLLCVRVSVFCVINTVSDQKLAAAQ